MTRLRAAGLVLAAPILAFGFALAVTLVILALARVDPLGVMGDAIAYGLRPVTLVAVVNKAIPYYLAGIAAAVGFHLRLFNIGIDGQYRLGAFAAAVIGAAVSLPAPLHVALVVVVAMVVGWGWAAIAGMLYVRRGVNVVISTIMLNAVASGIIAWLLSPARLAQQAAGSNNVTTATIPASGWIPSIAIPGVEGAGAAVNGFVLVAIAVGIGYWLVLHRTTVGFEVRAMGLSGRAANVAGIRAPRLALLTMAASGAIAGLVGLPQLLGAAHHFGLDFPSGLAFTGLSVAILGRNHPVGVAIGAFAWAFIERSAQVLDLAGVSREVVTILQAVTVLAIVVAYELVRRIRARQERRYVARAVEGAPGVTA